ncbi:MAG: DUF2851 family protein [Bacteroidetes bacterium]|nr:DUF2851 family protein [Bacteroidota bacterium]
MEEAFLHFVWQHGLFDQLRCRGTHGELIEIVNRGYPNFDSGPDFLDAHIRINSQLWIGNVEIHIHSAEWYQHRHHKDFAYDNTILHVVLTDNDPAFLPTGTRLVTIELKDHIPRSLYGKYEALRQNFLTIPCSNVIQKIPQSETEEMMETSLLYRLHRKSAYLLELLKQMDNDWQKAFYVFFCRYLGFKVNSDAMENLARITPISLIQKNRDQPELVDALLFGQAGMLQYPIKNQYYQTLRKEYQYQKHKNNLVPLNPVIWKFLRMRPVNFPTLKIAQLSAILQTNYHFFSWLLDIPEPREIKAVLISRPSAFWKTHYHFNKKSAPHAENMGNQSVNGLLTNVVAPVWFAYGRVHHQNRYSDAALQLLHSLPAENNKLIRQYSLLGFPNQSARDSQGLMGLSEFFCIPKKCTNCAIGKCILSA